MKIEIENMGFAYPHCPPVLKDINLKFEGSGFISILGPNGVGKSTLIHCINKLLIPTEGTVTVDDVNVNRYTLKDLAKKVSYVPCFTSDSFPLTVIDTILIGRHPYSSRRTTEADFEKVYQILKLLEIKDLSMRPFNELSAGQHQKVALARGLVQETQILLLDEPTSNLDIRHQIEVSQILSDLAQKNGIMIIMICHDLNIASKYSDKIIMMSEGTIHSIGTPEEVLTEENILEVYGVESKVVIDEGRPHVILRNSNRSAQRENKDGVMESA